MHVFYRLHSPQVSTMTSIAAVWSELTAAWDLATISVYVERGSWSKLSVDVEMEPSPMSGATYTLRLDAYLHK